MKIPENIEVDLSGDEGTLCDKALAACQKYSHAAEENWVAGILAYLFESYLRLSVALDANTDASADGRARCFAEAHEAPPLLAPHLMNIAARAMRRLTVRDCCEVVAYAETLAQFGHRGASLRGTKALLDWLSKRLRSDTAETQTAAGAERKRASHFIAQQVFETQLGASRLLKMKCGAPSSNTNGLIFLTLGTDDEFLTDDPVSHPEATIFSQGNRQSGLFSPYAIGRGTWRLNIHFSLFNNTKKTLVVYDIHAKVYNRLKDAKVLATVGHSMSVELLKDNSILGKHPPVNLDPKDSLNVDLALEASLFESLKTTVVFGLLIDFYSVENGSAVKRVLPSDALYVFQHVSEMCSKCHFVSRTIDEIKARMKTEAANSEVQDACQSLLKSFDQHIAHHADPMNETQDVEDASVIYQGNRKSEAAALALDGIKCSESGRFEEGVEKCQRALAIIREIGDKELECTMLDTIAGIYYMSKAFQSTLDYANMELDVARRINSRKHEATALTVAGGAQYSLGKHPVAIELHLRALAIARAERDRSLEALILYELPPAR